MEQTRRTQGERQAKTSAGPGPSGPGEEVGATQGLPAGWDFPPKGPKKTAFWFLCRREQRNPPPGRRNSLREGVGSGVAGGETPPLPHTMGCLGGRMISAPTFTPFYFLRAGEVDSPYQGEMAEGQKG